MITEIISDGFSLDLAADIPIPLNLSISDFREPQNRKRNFSKQVDLPGTLNNLRFFKGTFNLTVKDTNVNFDPTVKVNATLIKDGITQLQGNIQLNHVTLKHGSIAMFTVTLYSDAVDLFLLLQNKRVSELDWSAYNHPLTRDNIIDSWTAAKGSGYWYPPIIKDGNKPSILTWRTQDFFPYVYLKEAFLKSMEFAGISVDSDFINNDEDFESVVFGYGGGDLNLVSQAEADNRRVILGNLNYFGESGIQQLGGFIGAGYQEFVQFDMFFNINTLDFFQVIDNINQYNNGAFMTVDITHSGNYELSFVLEDIISQLNVGVDDIIQTRPVELLVYKNGVAINQITSEITSGDDTTGFHVYSFENSAPIELYLLSGNQLTFAFRFSYEMDNVSPFLQLDVSGGEVNDDRFRLIFKGTQISDNDTVVVSRFIPDMTCAELVLNTFRQFNLYMSDFVGSTVKIEPFPDFYQDTNDFDDWSEMVDYSKDMIIRPTANEYGKKVVFRFAETSEDDSQLYAEKYGERYGDYTLEQGGYYAKGEKVISVSWGTIIPYDIGFASNEVKVPRFVNVNASTGEVKTCKPVPRIGINTGLQTGTIVVRNTDNTISTTVNQYGAMHHFNSFDSPTFDLNFRLVNELFYEADFITTSNCYNLFYFEFINEVINSAGKLLEAYIQLNPKDVNELDFSRLKMIDGALFRLNAVKDFDSDFVATTKCEFIKVLAARKRQGLMKPINPPAPDVPIYGDLGEPIGGGDEDTGTGAVIGGTTPTQIYGKLIIG